MPAEPFKFDGVADEWKMSQTTRFCGFTVLDVGCNAGHVAHALYRMGYFVEGVEIDPYLLSQARHNYPMIRFHSSIESVRGKFDTVLAWNVLEHIEDDGEALKQLRGCATTNVLLSVPREDEISLPESRVTYRPYVDPTHKHYYTRERILELAPNAYIEPTTRVRPLLAYVKLGIPRWVCLGLDNLFWGFARNRESFYANYLVNIPC